MFEWDYEIALGGRRSWNNDVKTILTRCHTAHLFERDQWCRRPVDTVINQALCQVRNQLVLRERDHRHQAAQSMSRMRLYNGISDSLPTETALYISMPLSRS